MYFRCIQLSTFSAAISPRSPGPCQYQRRTWAGVQAPTGHLEAQRRDRPCGWRGWVQAVLGWRWGGQPQACVACGTARPKCTLLPSVFVVSPANPSSRMPRVISSSLCPCWLAPFNPITGIAVLKVWLNDAPSPAQCFTCFWGLQRKSLTRWRLRQQFIQGDALKYYFRAKA